MKAVTRNTYSVVFQHRGAIDREPAAVRRFLKRALRSAGLVCIDIKQETTREQVKR
jgi:hypothetical protein